MSQDYRATADALSRLTPAQYRVTQDDGTEPAALTDVKQLATFACFTRTARPLYTVTYVPDNKVTSQDTTTGQGNQGGNNPGTKVRAKTLGGGIGQP